MEILQGAQGFLSSTMVGVKYEVEFAPLYQGQALFGDVDKYLRQFGYMLFDLSRSRYRGAGFPAPLSPGASCFGATRFI
jgi:hypothetical protein